MARLRLAVSAAVLALAALGAAGPAAAARGSHALRQRLRLAREDADTKSKRRAWSGVKQMMSEVALAREENTIAHWLKHASPGVADAMYVDSVMDASKGDATARAAARATATKVLFTLADSVARGACPSLGLEAKQVLASIGPEALGKRHGLYVLNDALDDFLPANKDATMIEYLTLASVAKHAEAGAIEDATSRVDKAGEIGAKGKKSKVYQQEVRSRAVTLLQGANDAWLQICGMMPAAGGAAGGAECSQAACQTVSRMYNLIGDVVWHEARFAGGAGEAAHMHSQAVAAVRQVFRAALSIDAQAAARLDYFQQLGGAGADGGAAAADLSRGVTRLTCTDLHQELGMAEDEERAALARQDKNAGTIGQVGDAVSGVQSAVLNMAVPVVGKALAAPISMITSIGTRVLQGLARRLATRSRLRLLLLDGSRGLLVQSVPGGGGQHVPLDTDAQCRDAVYHLVSFWARVGTTDISTGSEFRQLPYNNQYRKMFEALESHESRAKKISGAMQGDPATGPLQMASEVAELTENTYGGVQSLVK